MKILLSIFMLCVSTFVHSDDVVMAFGESIPPFSFPETNSGIEIEIISEALALNEHTLVPRYFPLARVPIAFRSKQVDAAMTDLGHNMLAFNAHYGSSAVVYDNVFITLRHRNIVINNPDDLSGLSVLSFQGAIKRYPEWLDNVDKHNNYRELNNQLLQVLTLHRDRYDVVLSDISIFKYYTLQAERKTGKKLRPIQHHRFIEVNPDDYRPVFWDEHIRDDFNEGIEHLKATGRYQAIYDKYLK